MARATHTDLVLLGLTKALVARCGPRSCGTMLSKCSIEKSLQTFRILVHEREVTSYCHNIIVNLTTVAQIKEGSS